MDQYLYLVINDGKWERIPNSLVDVVPYLHVEFHISYNSLKICALPLSKFPSWKELNSVLPRKVDKTSKNVVYSDAYLDIRKFLSLFGTGWFDLVIDNQKIDCSEEWNWDTVNFDTLSPKQIDRLLSIELMGKNLSHCYLPSGETKFNLICGLFCTAEERHILTRDTKF